MSASSGIFSVVFSFVWGGILVAVEYQTCVRSSGILLLIYWVQDRAAGTSKTEKSSSAEVRSSEVCGSLRKGC